MRRRAEALPERTRHLAIHANHLVDLNALDAGSSPARSSARSASQSTRQVGAPGLSASEQAGVTEIVLPPPARHRARADRPSRARSNYPGGGLIDLSFLEYEASSPTLYAIPRTGLA